MLVKSHGGLIGGPNHQPNRAGAEPLYFTNGRVEECAADTVATMFRRDGDGSQFSGSASQASDAIASNAKVYGSDKEEFGPQAGVFLKDFWRPCVASKRFVFDSQNAAQVALLEEANQPGKRERSSRSLAPAQTGGLHFLQSLRHLTTGNSTAVIELFHGALKPLDGLKGAAAKSLLDELLIFRCGSDDHIQ